MYGKNEALNGTRYVFGILVKRNFRGEVLGEPKGETMVQSLYWLVYEIRGTQLNKRIDKIIKKRHKIEDNKFLFDPMENTALLSLAMAK